MSKQTPVLLTSETEVAFVKLREILVGHPVLLLMKLRAALCLADRYFV